MFHGKLADNYSDVCHCRFYVCHSPAALPQSYVFKPFATIPKNLPQPHWLWLTRVHFILIYPVHLKVIWAIHLKCCNQIVFAKQIHTPLHISADSFATTCCHKIKQIIFQYCIQRNRLQFPLPSSSTPDRGKFSCHPNYAAASMSTQVHHRPSGICRDSFCQHSHQDTVL